MSVRHPRSAVCRPAVQDRFRPNARLLWFAALAPLLCVLAGCEGAPAAEGVSSGYGYVCHAGFYQCTLPSQYPVGTRCQCPGLGAPSYGRVG